MRNIKVKFKRFHPGWSLELFKRYFSFLLPYYNFIESEDPDVLFFSSFSGNWNKPIMPDISKYHSKIPCIYIQGEYESIIQMNKCDYAISTHFLDNEKHLTYPYYFMRLNYQNISIETLLKKYPIDFHSLKRSKKNFCNFVYSNSVEIRNNFFYNLSKYKHIDSAGKCCNNMNKILPNRKGINFSYKEKYDFIKNYKFTIAFENQISLNGTSEKIVDPMLVNSIPIYWGNPNIHTEFNTKSFINFYDFNSFNGLIEKIKKIDNDQKEYEAMLNEPWLKNNKIPEYLNINNYINFFKEIF